MRFGYVSDGIFPSVTAVNANIPATLKGAGPMGLGWYGMVHSGNGNQILLDCLETGVGGWRLAWDADAETVSVTFGSAGGDLTVDVDVVNTNINGGGPGLKGLMIFAQSEGTAGGRVDLAVNGITAFATFPMGESAGDTTEDFALASTMLTGGFFFNEQWYDSTQPGILLGWMTAFQYTMIQQQGLTSATGTLVYPTSQSGQLDYLFDTRRFLASGGTSASAVYPGVRRIPAQNWSSVGAAATPFTVAVAASDYGVSNNDPYFAPSPIPLHMF
jgi:hypothetical protein